MARPKAFDEHAALDPAIDLFRERGFEGTSASALVEAMGIGRQSLYDTYGDKWRLYLAAVRRYVQAEIRAHLAALGTGPRAIDGLKAMIDRVVRDADLTCLGVGSICEFGRTHPDLSSIHDSAASPIRTRMISLLAQAKSEGDVAGHLDPAEAADFLRANIAAIRLAARGGASHETVASIARIALGALH